MRLLLLNPPSTPRVLRDFFCPGTIKAAYYWPPIDLLVLSGLLAERFEISVLDATVMDLGSEDALRMAEEARPDVVVSLVSVVSLREDMAFLRALKGRCGAQAYAIGDLPRYEPEWLLRQHDFLDGALRSFVAPALGDFLAGARESVTDVAFREGEEIHLAPETTRGGVSYGLPQHERFPLHRYEMPFTQRRPMSTVMLHYGCPHRCTFCNSANVPFLRRSLEEFQTELRHIKRLGVQSFLFRDFTFGPSVSQGLAAVDALAAVDGDFEWYAECRPESFDAELAGAMARAGCRLVMFGVEAASPEVLSATLKPMAAEEVRSAFAAAREAGMLTTGFFILGFPHEDERDVRATIELALSLPCDYAVFSAYAPTVGSALRDSLVADGTLDRYDFASSDPSLPRWRHPRISPRRMATLLREAHLRFYARPSALWRLTRSSTPQSLARNVAGGVRNLWR